MELKEISNRELQELEHDISVDFINCNNGYVVTLMKKLEEIDGEMEFRGIEKLPRLNGSI